MAVEILTDGKNKAIRLLDIVYVFTDGKYPGSFYVDASDWDLIKVYRWCLHNAKTKANYMRVRAGNLYVHNLLISIPGKVIDHIDRNTLNNCQSNLRGCTRADNSRNRTKAVNNTTGYVGVNYETGRGRPWTACIHLNNKKKHLGRFDSKEEAALAYNQAASAYFGDYAVLNKIKEEA